MIGLEGEIQKSSVLASGKIRIAFIAKVGWMSRELVQLFLSKKDAQKILNIEFDNLGNLERLNHRKIAVLIHI